MVEASILETDEAMATSPALRESTVTLSGSILQSEDEIGKIILPINIYIFIRCLPFLARECFIFSYIGNWIAT